MCKVLESIIRESIVEHITSNNLISNTQHGFLPKRSCVTQLLTSMEYWTDEIQKGNPVDVLYVDFKKAFDKVPHKRLLTKLKAYGIIGKLLNWIYSFLVGRKQRVTINSFKSTWVDVVSGVPQGSVLEPTFFLIYINDLPHVLLSPYLLFADDTKIYSHIRSEDDIMSTTSQQDIDELLKWSEMWQMPFNISKCKCLHMGRSNPNHVYSMGGRDIEQTVEERDLGVLIDNQLKFHDHSSMAAGKARRLLGLISKCFINLTPLTFSCLYNTIVRPILEYGNVVWGPNYKLDEDLVEKVQRKAIKLVPSIRHLPYKERLWCLGLPSLKHRRLRGDMIMTYNILHGYLDIDESIFFVRSWNSTEAILSNCLNLLPSERCVSNFNLDVLSQTGMLHHLT